MVVLPVAHWSEAGVAGQGKELFGGGVKETCEPSRISMGLPVAFQYIIRRAIPAEVRRPCLR